MVKHSSALAIPPKGRRPTGCILVSADDVMHDPLEEFLRKEQLIHGPSGTPIANDTL